MKNDKCKIPPFDMLLESFLENSSVIAWMKDADGRHVFLSENYKKRFGATDEEWIGKTDFEIWPREIAEYFMCNDLAVLENGQTIEVEEKAVNPDGTISWWLNHKFVFEDSAGNRFVRGLGVDITRSKVAEQRVAEHTAELQEQNLQLVRLAEEHVLIQHRERTRLASRLHEDLQQLLVAASMKAKSFSSRGDLPDAQHLETLKYVLGQAIETTRTLTRELAPPLSLAGNLSDAFDWLVREMKDRYDAFLHIHIAGEVNVVPEAEGIVLYTAARELLANVIKHSGAPYAELELRREDEWITLTVSDSGRGFDVDSVLNRHEGFGLLSIRERVQLLGGKFIINSTPSGGVEAVLTIPFDSGLPGHLHSKGASASEKSEKMDPKTEQEGDLPEPVMVLLVDDHRMVRESLRVLLASESNVIIVGECGDGRRAVESVEKLQPDVVLMDVSMPVMDGMEATKLIKKRWPYIRVIGLSMYSEEEMGKKMRSAGADAFLTKSAPHDELMEAIRRCNSMSGAHGSRAAPPH